MYWTGNNQSIFTTLGASNHAREERQQDDYYATHPIAAEHLMMLEQFNHRIWECACGEKHLSNVFEKYGYDVRNSDLFDRCGNEIFDFLDDGNKYWDGDIITNPPYRYAREFIEKALSIIPNGNKVAMFLKVQFLEGKERKKLFSAFPPKVVYVSSSRILCAKNGKFDKYSSSAVAYAWYVWEKGYKGNTVIKWFN